VEAGQFRFGYFTPEYEATVAFYRDGLELPLVDLGIAAPMIEGHYLETRPGSSRCRRCRRAASLITSGTSVLRKGRAW